MYVQAAVEALPTELDGVAGEIYVNFPWGSLLRAVAAGDARVLYNLRRICAPGADLKVLFTIDAERDRSEIERLGLPVFDDQYLNAVLPGRYAMAGFSITKAETLSTIPAELQTSWGKRLRVGSGRKIIHILATAAP